MEPSQPAITNNLSTTTEIVKCGNCDLVAAGQKNRSIWAQVIVWILFIPCWIITVCYYLINPKYICSNCKSDFVGVKDKNNKWMSQKSGMNMIFILLIALVAIAILGILSSIVLASLGAARQKGIDAENNRPASGNMEYNLNLEDTRN